MILGILPSRGSSEIKEKEHVILPERRGNGGWKDDFAGKSYYSSRLSQLFALDISVTEVQIKVRLKLNPLDIN